MQGSEPKFTKGEISSLSGSRDDPRQFQISVAVQPGNSGGALVDQYGNVIGVVNAKLGDLAALKSSGAIPQNVNYAIKSSYVLSLLESLPDLQSKLGKPATTSERPIETIIKEVERATALVIVY